MTEQSVCAVALGAQRHENGPMVAHLLDALPGSVDEALAAAPAIARVAPLPGSGSTLDLWEGLATLAAHDLGVARAVEPHLDAVAILRQAEDSVVAGTTDAAAGDTRTWGVFAAEGGPDPLVATPTPDGWILDGTKPWCSLADRLTDALVGARTADGERRLFAVSLAEGGVHPDVSAWHARGLAEIPSGPVRFDRVPAAPVGDAGWYLARPGFAWGGIGVAACWYGGAVGIARTVFDAALADDASPFLLMHLGAIDAALQSARRALAEAVRAVDAGDATGDAGSLLAKRVRAAVAWAAETTVVRSGHALGPAPLALDPAHAKRVADLQLYVRQHHAERDENSLGRALAGSGVAPW